MERKEGFLESLLEIKDFVLKPVTFSLFFFLRELISDNWIIAVIAFNNLLCSQGLFYVAQHLNYFQWWACAMIHWWGARWDGVKAERVALPFVKSIWVRAKYNVHAVRPTNESQWEPAIHGWEELEGKELWLNTNTGNLKLGLGLLKDCPWVFDRIQVTHKGVSNVLSSNEKITLMALTVLAQELNKKWFIHIFGFGFILVSVLAADTNGWNPGHKGMVQQDVQTAFRARQPDH